MDVYTNPPSNTHKVNERFTVSLNGKSVDAIAVTAHVFLLVAATHAIFIQLLFAAAWNIVFNILLWNLHDGDRIKILGLVTFWNYPDPFSAAFSSFGYLTMLLRGEDSHNRNPQYLIPAVIISFCSTTIAVTGLLDIQMSPPAHPAEVYFPDLGQPTAGAAINFGSFDRPSILRALGSAEAGELNTQLSKVSVELFDHPGGTVAGPQQAVQWHYTLTAGELNMQIMPDLELQVILTSLLSQPAGSRVGMRAGVASLKSYTGSLRGTVIDAGSVSNGGDTTRLILSGYLWTREIMRDLVLSTDPSARNLLEKPVGVLMPGAAAFIIRSSDVATLSYAAVLAAPILTVVLTIFAMGFHTAPRFPSVSGKLARRAAALRATKLFRPVDELSNTDPSLRGGLVSSMPRPTGTQGWTTTLHHDEPTGGENEGPRIQFTHDG
ncbi:hypothetical protein BKA56DRAFT_669950 [Ilyonectria sp. MPI-CAGE-AT-0026]|nr:hypothetical protein BKA56DRAFT_669950 [Ilyonectria sp. MPI-CAGE-AT-0026]